MAQRKKKEVIDWLYPIGLRGVMQEFEELVETIRSDVARSDWNLVAGRRARLNLQKLKNEKAPLLRKALFKERDLIKTLRGGK